MTRRVRVTFTADEISEGQYKLPDEGGPDLLAFTVYLSPDRDAVDVVEISREYDFGQVYKVSSNSTFDPNGYGLWLVIRDRNGYSNDGYRFACPQSGHIYSQGEWDKFIAGRTIELVNELVH